MSIEIDFNKVLEKTSLRLVERIKRDIELDGITKLDKVDRFVIEENENDVMIAIKIFTTIFTYWYFKDTKGYRANKIFNSEIQLIEKMMNMKGV